MKKSIFLLLALALIFTCAGCGNSKVELDALISDALSISDTSLIPTSCIQNPAAKAEVSGTKLSVLQAVTYDSCMCILTEVTFPSGTQLTSGDSFLLPVTYQLYSGTYDRASVVEKAALISEKGACQTVSVDEESGKITYLFRLSGDHSNFEKGETVSFLIGGFGTGGTADSELSSQLLLSWKLSGVEQAKRVSSDGGAIVGEALITPFSAYMVLTKSPYTDSDTQWSGSISITDKSGKAMDIVSMVSGGIDDSGMGIIVIYPDKAIDFGDAASITIDGSEFKF